MHVTLVGGFDRRQPSAGGVRAYVEALGSYLDSAGVPRMTILSGSTWESGQSWCSIPVKKGGSTAYGMASLFANARGIPIPRDSIVHAQRPDYLLPFVWERIGAASVCTIHGDPLHVMRETRSRIVSSAYAVLEAAMLRRFTRVVFVDSAAAKAYQRRYSWLGDISEVIPNGVDTHVFQPHDKGEEKQKWGLEGTTLLYAGRLEPEKRVVEIISAFRALGVGACELVIAGDGRDRQMAEAHARGAKVRFLGTLARADMPSIMSAVDAIILFSTFEGLPSVVLEALACGTPVISTPVGDIPDVIHDGANGRLISSREGLVGAMKQVCEGEIPHGQSLRDSVDRFSWSKLGPKVLRVYQAARAHAS